MTDIYEPKVGDVIQITATVTEVCENGEIVTKTADCATNCFTPSQFKYMKLLERPVESPKVGEIWETRVSSWSYQYEIIAISDTQLVVKFIKHNAYFVWSHGHYTVGVNFFKVS